MKCWKNKKRYIADKKHATPLPHTFHATLLEIISLTYILITRVVVKVKVSERQLRRVDVLLFAFVIIL